MNASSMQFTYCSLSSNSINSIVDHYQAMILPGLSHPTQLPPSEHGKQKSNIHNTIYFFIFNVYSIGFAVCPTFRAVMLFCFFHKSSGSLLCAGIIDFTVVENSARHVVAHRSSTDIDEPVGLH